MIRCLNHETQGISPLQDERNNNDKTGMTTVCDDKDNDNDPSRNPASDLTDGGLPASTDLMKRPLGHNQGGKAGDPI
jgi:hypothetical protein